MPPHTRPWDGSGDIATMEKSAGTLLQMSLQDGSWDASSTKSNSRDASKTISVKSGIYLIMGVKSGTPVTKTIVAIDQTGSKDKLERAHRGATVHELFNTLPVAVLFPVKLAGQDKQGWRWVGPLPWTRPRDIHGDIIIIIKAIWTLL